LFNQNQTTLIEYPHGLAGSYTVPGTVTSIDSEALSSSPNLTSVTIPSSVTSIGAQAFQYDSSLTSALFQGNAPTMGQAVFHLAGNGFTVSYAGGATGFTSPTWTDSAGDTYPAINVSISDLFGGTVSGAGVKRSPWFGHYLYGSYPLVYQYNLGYEYAYAGPNGGVYLYDYTSGHFWYTQSGYFPFVYDFTLNCYLYYYAGNGSPRYFYKFSAINPGVITL